MKISIIVPVYNSQEYLTLCIKSVLKQTHRDFELLLIDDESKDESGRICDEYASKDARVKVLHKKNGGTSAARNSGIRLATGDYITFMDNDDYWKDDDCLEKMLKQLEESYADVLLFSTMEYWEKDDTYSIPNAKCRREEIVYKDKSEALKRLISEGLLYRAVWSKVIKTTLIQENELYFKENFRNEDSDWTARLLLCANTYDWYEKVFYVYRKGHVGAQTSKPNTYKTVNDLKVFCEEYIKIAETTIKDQRFKEVFYSYIAYPYSVWMAQAKFIKDKVIKEDIKEMKKYAFVLNYDIDPSVKTVKKVYKIFGYRITSYILKIYMKKKYYS